jgi:hypothetical protein
MVRLLGLARRNRNDPETFAGLVHASRYCGLLDASLAAHGEARRLDPHVSTSVIFTLWALGDYEGILAESSDAGDFELRCMALHATGRTDDARRLLDRARAQPHPRVAALFARAFQGVLEGSPHALSALADVVEAHADPEALYMFGAWQVLAGDAAAGLDTLTRAVDGGYCVPQALAHPWLQALRGERLEALVARAQAGRQLAERAFHEAGGPALLGI